MRGEREKEEEGGEGRERGIFTLSFPEVGETRREESLPREVSHFLWYIERNAKFSRRVISRSNQREKRCILYSPKEMSPLMPIIVSMTHPSGVA